jgi:hypothetical protein
MMSIEKAVSRGLEQLEASWSLEDAWGGCAKFDG